LPLLFPSGLAAIVALAVVGFEERADRAIAVEGDESAGLPVEAAAWDKRILVLHGQEH